MNGTGLQPSVELVRVDIHAVAADPVTKAKIDGYQTDTESPGLFPGNIRTAISDDFDGHWTGRWLRSAGSYSRPEYTLAFSGWQQVVPTREGVIEFHN